MYFMQEKNLNDLTFSVNEELDKIHNWSSANKLFLNIQKPKILIFSQPVKSTDSKRIYNKYKN